MKRHNLFFCALALMFSVGAFKAHAQAGSKIHVWYEYLSDEGQPLQATGYFNSFQKGLFSFHVDVHNVTVEEKNLIRLQFVRVPTWWKVPAPKQVTPAPGVTLPRKHKNKPPKMAGQPVDDRLATKTKHPRPTTRTAENGRLPAADDGHDAPPRKLSEKERRDQAAEKFKKIIPFIMVANARHKIGQLDGYLRKTVDLLQNAKDMRTAQPYLQAVYGGLLVKLSHKEVVLAEVEPEIRKAVSGIKNKRLREELLKNMDQQQKKREAEIVRLIERIKEMAARADGDDRRFTPPGGRWRGDRGVPGGGRRRPQYGDRRGGLPDRRP